jgi:hypothetical protein
MARPPVSRHAGGPRCSTRIERCCAGQENGLASVPPYPARHGHATPPGWAAENCCGDAACSGTCQGWKSVMMRPGWCKLAGSPTSLPGRTRRLASGHLRAWRAGLPRRRGPVPRPSAPPFCCPRRGSGQVVRIECNYNGVFSEQGTERLSSLSGCPWVVPGRRKSCLPTSRLSDARCC